MKWLEGARLRTLPAALAPVILGTGMAFAVGGGHWSRALLALLVALALQVGVNFANDYSDGIRGTDKNRVGPPRLTAGGTNPKLVLGCALGCFALAGVAGLVLLALSGDWWLIVVGLAAVAAAWFYTGGKNPYGYIGWIAEILVFVFFGLFAVLGTLWVQAHELPWQAWFMASGLGFLSMALLMVNNIRDIVGDRAAGKFSAAVRLGSRRARQVFALWIWLAMSASLVVVVFPSGFFVGGMMQWGLGLPLQLVLWLLSLRLIRPVSQGATGAELIGVLRNTGLFTLAYGLCFALYLSQFYL